MIDFELTEDQRLVRDAVADLSRETLRENLRHYEHARRLPDELTRRLFDMGLPLASLPETLGGQGFGIMSSVLIEEELGAGDPSVAYAMPGPGPFARALLELGTDDQQRRHLPDFADGGPERMGAVAFSERAPNKERTGMTTVAKRDGDGWILSGKKAFVGNADRADRFVVFAQIEPERGWDGLGAFVVRRAHGLTTGERHVTLGLDAASFGEIALDGVHVSDADRLVGGSDFVASTLRFFLKQGLLVAARAVGLSRAAFDVTRDYCDTRKAFGKPIGHFQAVAFKLADRLMDADGARWMVWRAAWAWDAGQPEKECMKLSAHAIAHALEGAMRCADDAVQLHGGAGFMRDYPVEKMMRDAKQMSLTTMTPEQLDQVASAISLGARLDPALVLPTPETQAIFTLSAFDPRAFPETTNDHRLFSFQEAARPPRRDREPGTFRGAPGEPGVGPRETCAGRLSPAILPDGEGHGRQRGRRLAVLRRGEGDDARSVEALGGEQNLPGGRRGARLVRRRAPSHDARARPGSAPGPRQRNPGAEGAILLHLP
jgi:alkylation response protein AidB-like acyl-CoA dehydrogenase